MGQRSRSAPATDAEAAGLTYVSDGDPGIRRVRRGRHFSYVGPDGRTLRDAAGLRRIRSLAIPPAYGDVWICADPRGHIQATARDARGRKQYRYHARWRALRDADKFEGLLEFGRQLPRLRARLRRDLALPGMPREKVLAAVVMLLDRTLIRVGNPEYARLNKSYGATTLRNSHVQFLGDGRARIRFNGKGGQAQDVALGDAQLVRILRRCQDLPGQRLFQYRLEDGECRPIDSGMVNEYLRAATGCDFTAKHFRTWGATLHALAFLAPRPRPQGAHDLSAGVAETARHVAVALGNTPAVCRKSYIHPAAFEAWSEGALTPPAAAASRSVRAMERVALKVLRRRGGEGARARRDTRAARLRPGAPGRQAGLPSPRRFPSRRAAAPRARTRPPRPEGGRTSAA